MTPRTTALTTLLALLGCLAQAIAAVPDSLITTPAGKVRGLTVGPSADVRWYRSIPYAAPPVGELRWREPQPAAHWAGVRDAPVAPGCIQPIGDHLPWTAEYMHHGPVSEDCLYLNVWRPAAPGPHPVMVFFYGGGFSEGSIAVPLYDGAALAHQGLVFVTVNYRVGALGFLAHPALTQESAHHSSGNYGLLDQLAALRWVRSNIAAFGGDPQRVTIAGQSAGAIATYLLTAIPQAHGLFQRAIIQSGPGALAAVGLNATDSIAGDFKLAQNSGVQFAQSHGATTAAQLRALPASHLLPAPGVRFGPVVDGWLLPQSPEKLYAQHRQNDVPWLTGMMADEGSAFGSTDAAKVASARAQGLHGLDELLSRRARSSHQPAFAYLFTHPIPWPEHPEFGAFHSGELPYVFDNLALLDRHWSAIDRDLAKTASADWVRFATDGSPGDGWTAYRPGMLNFMVFGDTAAMQHLSAP